MVLGAALLASGCARSVHIGPKCEGLERLGYRVPVTEDELAQITAMGYRECANYLESTKRVKRG